LKVWQEEFSRIINFNIEQECNRFLKKKIYDWQSSYQSEIIPIQKCKKLDEFSNTFLGRVLRELQFQVDPKKCTYISQLNGWYDIYTNVEIIGSRFFTLLFQSVGVHGLYGIDTLTSFNIVRYLQKFKGSYEKLILENEAIKEQVIKGLENRINPPSTLPVNITKYYALALSKLYKVWDFFADIIIKIGTSQLIRKHICSQLNVIFFDFL
jgi:WASH complex subunit strumpellin